MKWSCVYESAIREDGSLYFAEKLTHAFLDQQRRTQGVYIFSNQYLNKVIPDGEQDFKHAWLRTYTQLPQNTYTFAFIDPAISLEQNSDYTATVVVKVDADKNWYVTHALRQRITATDTVKWIFKLHRELSPLVIGIEEVAYQSALTHFVAEEMLKRKQIIPIKGVKRARFTAEGGKKSDNSKPARIRSLIPRFEFGQIYLAQGLDDLLLEYKAFPRGSYDDLLDALSSIEEIVFYPDKPKEVHRAIEPNDPGYEKTYIQRLHKAASRPQSNDDY